MALSVTSLSRARTSRAPVPSEVRSTTRNSAGQEAISRTRVGWETSRSVSTGSGSASVVSWSEAATALRAEVRTVHGTIEFRNDVRRAMGHPPAVISGETGSQAWTLGEAEVELATSGAMAALEGVATAMRSRLAVLLQTEVVYQKKRTAEKPRRWRTQQTRKR